LLRSIDASLKQLVAASVQHVAGGAGAASEADLSDPRADETVKLNPRDWTGDSFKGHSMSMCPPAFLEELAKAHDYFAKKNEGKLTDKGKPKSDFERRSAGRARGWAARLRAGWRPPAIATAASDDLGTADDFGTAEGYGSGGLEDEPF
jgi:hypothetical protein